jgi:hypothetical protein
MSYQLQPQQVNDLAHLLTQRADHIAALIARAITANSQYIRPAAVTLNIKVCRNADDPRLIEVWAQEKTKAPKSKFSDITEWDESEMIQAFRIDEVPGQLRLDRASDSVLSLHQHLKDNDSSLTMHYDGKSVTIGKDAAAGA